MAAPTPCDRQAGRAVHAAFDGQVERVVGDAGIAVDAAVVRGPEVAPRVVVGVAVGLGIRHRPERRRRRREVLAEQVVRLAGSPYPAC